MESTQFGEGFTQEDYAALVEAMFNGTVVVSNDSNADVLPTTQVVVNLYPNIK